MLNFAANYEQLLKQKTTKMRKTVTTMMTALALATVCANAYTLKRVSVHDPSIVWEPSSKYYYIFGSHRAAARTKDLMSWNSLTAPWGLVSASGSISSGAANDRAFVTNQTKTVTIGGKEVAFGNFDAQGWSAALGNYSIDGNMWAPDVIWNEKMQKWCMYLSINGPAWNSSIILLTATKITGPYIYQGPVIFSGFNVNNNANVSYKKTDLELVIGTQSSCPSRYTAYWGRRWPHAIDPCVFYDEEGRLWMSYGSWSGGIWILELNEENGLRDYDVVYPSTGGNGDGVTSDPYFGKKIAGGFYSSGEGSYIEHIGKYYFLFISNGGLDVGGKTDDYNCGGYQMRVFRSANPNGPYVDAGGRGAVLTAYELNFGPNCSQRGVNIFGAYGEWGHQTVGNYSERSQGHNSIIAAEDGRTYLVYHTRFQNRGGAHEVRVHQVFQNQDGWLVAAPFEYTGEAVTSADIASTQQVPLAQIAGTYQLMIHKYGIDHRKKELVKPEEIVLHADGTITGTSRKGTWSVVDGTSYVNITLGGVTYKGVMVEQTLEPTTTKTVAFTALLRSGVTIWGYRTGDDPTGIAGVTVQPTAEDGPLFDLNGRRVERSGLKQGGIYIENGRKRIVKM